MRKFLAMVLSFIICASTVSVVANAAKFTDVPASDATLTKAVVKQLRVNRVIITQHLPILMTPSIIS